MGTLLMVVAGAIVVCVFAPKVALSLSSHILFGFLLGAFALATCLARRLSLKDRLRGFIVAVAAPTVYLGLFGAELHIWGGIGVFAATTTVLGIFFYWLIALENNRIPI